jgi:hypothetical protein
MKLIGWAGASLLLLLAVPVAGAETLGAFRCEPREVRGTTGQATTATVLSLPRPTITTRRYALAGRVKYDAVEGQGYLEMWSYFADRGQFFSRTLGAGLLQPLSGSSSWRDFCLPFLITEEDLSPPEKLVLNVVLPGQGTVELDAVVLRQFGENEDPMQVPGQWWDASTAGWIGGVLGSFMGGLGALVGVLSSRARARGVVLNTLRLLLVVGALALVLGLYAFAISQPYAVYYPLLLLGSLTVALGGGLYRQIRNRYVVADGRNIHALEG